RTPASEMVDEQPRRPARRCAEYKRMDVLALPDHLAHRLHRLTLTNDDVGLDPAFVEDFADRGADHAFDPKALLFLDGRLDSAELHEVLRFDDSQYLDPAVGLGRAARREAQRNRGFGAVVDHDQVGPFEIVPHAKRLLR